MTENTHKPETGIEVKQAQAFLNDYFDQPVSDIGLIGAGAWSRCFGFQYGDEALAIRFGHYLADFEKDQMAYQYHGADLPIPKVLDIGQAYDGYYAISTRVYGVPLESLNSAQWQRIIHAIVAALEAMRLADLSSTQGIGSWGVTQTAPYPRWADHLLAVAEDTPAGRTYGWRDRLATSSIGEETFNWGYELLQSIVSDSVPRSLLHCDLINRNVLVENNQLAGVFDWGCSLYGDHLYDLAWFEFWAPWFPELDIPALRTALQQQWQQVGYAPPDIETRLMACYLHIGLDHLAYNAYSQAWETLEATARQMRVLVAG